MHGARLPRHVVLFALLEAVSSGIELLLEGMGDGVEDVCCTFEALTRVLHVYDLCMWTKGEGAARVPHTARHCDPSG